MHRTDKERPRKEFQIKVPVESVALFRAATSAMVGNANETLFWEDRWLDGFTVCELAPGIYSRISKRIRRTRTVAEAVQSNTWAGDIGPDIEQGMLTEFLHLWSRITAFRVDEDAQDSLSWSWEKEGQFSARSSYAAKFMGLEVSPIAPFTWVSKAPMQCHFFAWLALKNRCWTADGLAKRGLPHLEACSLCDQQEETMDHLLVTFPFAKQVWHWISVATGRSEFSTRNDEILGEWCIQ
ncbi:hypothetical protein D1007_53990 [Hordeum vulgare]|nr:hypothetical protein D1007_53990 [Hordeum vulgare]